MFTPVITDDRSINEDSYDGLVSLIEASQGVLSLLIASCEPGDFQNQIINRYEAELAPNISSYRVVLNQQEPSLRAALEKLSRDYPELKTPNSSAVITVTGTAALMEILSSTDSNHQSELNRFFGYLQWTREGLREFPYPIVLWVTPKILSQLSSEAPDFWSWRSGVFRFVSPVVKETSVVIRTGEISLLIEPERGLSLPLEELLDQVENLEHQATATPALANLYNRVAQAYVSRVKTHQAQDYLWEIDRAIHFFHKSLALQEKLNLRTTQSDTLLQLGDIYRDLGWSERGLGSYQQALEIARSLGDPQREAAAWGGLGNLYQQYPQGDHANNLEQAIFAYQQALQVYTHEAFPEQWATIQNNLANAYRDRIYGERAENFAKAINASQLALQVYSRDAFPVQWAATQNNLANAYLHRIRGDRAENIEQAITSYQLVLQVYSRNAFPEQWAMTQNNLAIAYSKRIRGERAENIEQAITSYQLALQVYSRDGFPEQWAMTMNNLANAYYCRIRGDRSDNLEQAITAYKLALQVRTRKTFPEQWAMTHNDLANAYRDRIRGERADNLEQAINAYQLALQVYTPETFPEQWAMTQNNLAIAYSDRIQSERTDNLEQAITAYQLALQVYTPETFPEQWAMTQNNLAIAYSKRIRGERAENIEQAITSYQLALQVYSRDGFPEQWAMTMNNLANAYYCRIRGDCSDNLEQAITAYELALQVYTRDAFPRECRRTAYCLGNLHFEQHNWESATKAYSTALVAAEILYQSCILLDGKAAELAETADLPRRMAYALARIGDLETAVLTLEQGRARGLGESLDRDRTDLSQLQKIHPALYTKYQDITQQLRNLENQDRQRLTSEDRHSITPEAHRTNAIALRQQLEIRFQEIRQVPGYEQCLTLPTLDDIRCAVQRERPLVYLVSTPAGSLVLIFTLDDGIVDLWLNDLTETSLQEFLNTWLNTYNQFPANQTAWLDTIGQIAHQIWHTLMAPLINYLKQNSFQRATLIPTGILIFFPLHAAWTEDPNALTGQRYALDEICFTYIPNARALKAAQAIAQRTKADSILAIDNPLQDLPNSSREVITAIATFPQHKVLKHEQATISAVLAALPNYNVLHLCCHGTANLQTPLASGLLMSDGLITLRDILAFQFKGIRLAILSADETGLPGIDLPDEVISLTTGLLQAGVAGVIAPFWSVSDFSTMMLFTRFYDLWRNESLEIDQALRQAQQWVRDTTNREKIAYFRASLTGGNLPANVADYLYKFLILSRPEARDFAHPFHWAAFSYTGV
jgi:CHAT domain-containing protein